MNKIMLITPALVLFILQKVVLMMANFFLGGWVVGHECSEGRAMFSLIMYLAPSSVPII